MARWWYLSCHFGLYNIYQQTPRRKICNAIFRCERDSTAFTVDVGVRAFARSMCAVCICRWMMMPACVYAQMRVWVGIAPPHSSMTSIEKQIMCAQYTHTTRGRTSSIMSSYMYMFNQQPHKFPFADVCWTKTGGVGGNGCALQW